MHCDAYPAVAVLITATWLGVGVHPLVVCNLYGHSALLSYLAPQRFVQTRLCLLLQSSILLTPFFVTARTMRNPDDVVTFRVIFAFCGLFVLARAVMLLRRRDWYAACSPSAGFCTLIWFITASSHDAKAVTFEDRRRIDRGAWARHYLSAVAAAACALAVPAVVPATWAHALCVGQGMCGLLGLHALDGFSRGAWLLIGGIQLRPIMHSPQAAPTLGDFWRRWDTFIGDILADLAYRPLRRAGHGRKLATFVAFGCSGFLHAYPVVVAAVGRRTATTAARDALQVVAFFLTQPLLIALDEVLEKTPPLLRRLFVLGALFGPLPLLLGPYSSERLGAVEDGPEATAEALAATTTLAVALTLIALALALWRCEGASPEELRALRPPPPTLLNARAAAKKE